MKSASHLTVPTARALATEIVENTSAVSVALARQMMWKMLGADHPMEAHKIDSKAIYANPCSALSRISQSISRS